MNCLLVVADDISHHNFPLIISCNVIQHARTWGNGFIPIAEYGSEFSKQSKKGKQRMPVRLLYSGKNHYDLLV